jgi:type II secretory pathway component GspD/PulD (secretin)
MSGTADEGFTINWRGITVDQALTILSERAGLTINRDTSTSSAGTVDLFSVQPIKKDEIVALFNKVLVSHDLAAIPDGNVLHIMTQEQASDYAATPVSVVTNWPDIPNDAEEVTWVIPVHTLNPKQVLTDLYTLIPAGAKMNSSDAGTSVIMTGRQMDVRRFAQIISALDSTGNGDLEVFLLKFADSKALASELKDVFTQDTSTTPGAGGNPFAAFLGRGGRGGGGGGAAGATDESKRTGVHVNAVSDDQNNAVLVSAPADFMPGISNIITALDIPQEDTVQIRLFFLTNADCTSVANELLALFPDPTQSSQNQNNAGRRGAAQFGGGGFGGRGGAASAAAGMSDRLKKQVTVNAVPDPRTQSVLVTASKDTMDQIEKMIDNLDADTRGHVEVYTFKPQYANVLDFVGPMTDLFQQNGRSTSTSTQLNALQQRMQQGAQQNQINASSSISAASSGSGGGTGR